MKSIGAFNALGLLGLMMGAVSTAIFLTSSRYHPPPIDKKINQIENRRLVEDLTGLRLSPQSRILVASDGEPRDGTKGFFYWIIFTPEQIDLPWETASNPSRQDLVESVRVTENGIWPFKIKNPASIRYAYWNNDATDCRAKAVVGEFGVYMTIQTFTSAKP